MVTRPSILLATVLALSGAVAHPAATEAECGPAIPADDIRDYIGVAFTATVAEVTDEVDAPMADAAPFTWKVVLEVDRVYRGTVEDSLHWNGWGAGCSGIRHEMLKEGQRLFVSTDQLDPEGMRSPGYFTAIWREDGDGWHFFKNVLSYGSLDRRFPPEAERASNRRQIRKAVGALNRSWHNPIPREPRATDALDERPNAVEVNEQPGSAWVDETGAEVDGPPYGPSVVQMRVMVEDDRLVSLFRTSDGPSDVPPAQDLRYSLFVDDNGDGEADVELRTFADGGAWAAEMHRLDGQGNPVLAVDDLVPVVNGYGIGTSVDLDALGAVGDLRFLGQAASDGVYDHIPDDPDGWLALAGQAQDEEEG